MHKVIFTKFLGVNTTLLISYGFYFIRSSLWDSSLVGLTLLKRRSKGVFLLDLSRVGILLKRALSFISFLGKNFVFGFLFLEKSNISYLQNLFFFFDTFFESYRKRMYRFFFLGKSWFSGYLTNFKKIIFPLILRVKQGLLSEDELFSWQLPVFYPRILISGDLFLYKLAVNEGNLLNVPNLSLINGDGIFNPDVISYLLPANT